MAGSEGKIPPDRRARVGNLSSVREGSSVVIIGGGPGGYEAAIVAARMNADVTLIEEQGIGGSAVLSDVVPSKTLITLASQHAGIRRSFQNGSSGDGSTDVNMQKINEFIHELATTQSHDIAATLRKAGITIILGRATIMPGFDELGRRKVIVTNSKNYLQNSDERDGGNRVVAAHIVLVATGARPRELQQAQPDGNRIFNWTQLYSMRNTPEHLVVVGSGVTGAEFSGAFLDLGSKVSLVSSRERVLPRQDSDAAQIIEETFARKGMKIYSNSRAVGVTNTGESVAVTLTDGRCVEGTHCLMAVGSVPQTTGLGLDAVGVETTENGHILVDRVSRTTAYRIYAAGDCTGVLPLATVAAEQGRIAMHHALGDAVVPLDTAAMAQAIFTSPEVAAVGMTEEEALAHGDGVKIASLPLKRNPRAKMEMTDQGFVKMIASASGIVLGAVIVGVNASDLIYSLTLAVSQRMTVDQIACALTVYPTISGTISELARILH